MMGVCIVGQVDVLAVANTEQCWGTQQLFLPVW